MSLGEHLRRCEAAATESGQPESLYVALDRALDSLVGHRLFTLMVLAADGVKVRRVYSSRPEAYPVGGFKTHRQTPWGLRVLAGGEPYLGRDAEDLRWAFADHERIRGLGCESVLNVPVGERGSVLGTINLLHEAHHYRAEHIALVRVFCPLLAPVYARAVADEA